MKGRFTLSRDIFSHPIWKSESINRAQAWIELIGLANHERGFIISNGQKIVIERGQCGLSKLDYAKRWRWSRGKVDRFISMLESERMIIVKQYNGQGNGNTIITICNYDEYQFKKNEDRTTDRTSNGHQIGHQTGNGQDTNNNENNEQDGEARARVYTRETASVPPKNENEILKKENPPPKPPKISGIVAVNLLKRKEKGDKLSESEQKIVNSYLKSNGIQEPEKPHEIAYSRDDHAKQLIFQRDKLGRGYLLSKNDLEIIEEYEEKKRNNINLTGVIHYENQSMQLLQRAV